MRILALDLGSAWRGGQVQTLLVARELAGRGHEVTVGAPEESPLALRAAGGGLPVLPLPAAAEASPRLLLTLARAVRRIRPDVLWTGDARAHGAAVWSRASRRVPLAVHRRVVFRPRTNPLSRLKYALADRFFAVSGAVRDTLEAAGVDAKRISVVPDGLPPAAYLELQAPLPPPYRLTHAGAFDGRKGQDLVVEILAGLVAGGLDARVSFLGEGPARQAVEQRAKDLGVESRCAFPGNVDDVGDRLAGSHLLLLPSDSEASPLVLLEAMAAGCPALAHDVGGVSELTHGGKCCHLLPSLDPVAWTSGARDLLLDEPRRISLVSSGRAEATVRRIERTAGLLEDELDRVASCR